MIFLRSDMQKPIVVMGSVNFDLVATAERVPVPGETPDRGLISLAFHGGKASESGCRRCKAWASR